MRRLLVIFLLLPAVAFAQGIAMQTPDTQWQSARSVSVGPMHMVNGLPQLFVLRNWKGADRIVQLLGVTTDSWSQPLRDDENYVIYTSNDPAHPVIAVTSLDRSAEFSLLAYVEIGVWLAALIVLRMLWFFLRATSPARLVSFAGIGLAGGLIIALLLRPFIEPFLPAFMGLAIPPMGMVLGGIFGSIVSTKTEFSLPAWISALVVCLIGFLSSYFFDPLAPLLLVTAAIFVADAGRRALKKVAEDVRGRERFAPLQFLMISLMGYGLVAIDVWGRWTGKF